VFIAPPFSLMRVSCREFTTHGRRFLHNITNEHEQEKTKLNVEKASAALRPPNALVPDRQLADLATRHL